MEYLIIKDFIERKTLKQFRAGEKYPCSDSARADFLIRTGYLAPNEEKKEKPSVKEKPKKEAKPPKATTKRSTKTKKA